MTLLSNRTTFDLLLSRLQVADQASQLDQAMKLVLPSLLLLLGALAALAAPPMPAGDVSVTDGRGQIVARS